jgi:hypothetical protein
MEHHPGTIDIPDLKLRPFLEPQTAGVDGRETDSVAWDLDQAEKLVNLLDAENGRKLFLAGRANEVQGGQILVEGVLVEELDAAQGDGERTAGVFLDILEMEEILSQFFLGD